MKLEKILKGFNKTIQQLDNRINELDGTISTKATQVVVLENEMYDHGKERNQAKNVLKKLNDLVN